MTIRAILLGAVAGVSVMAQAALHFDGRAKLTVPYTPKLDIVHGITLEAWVRADSGLNERQTSNYFISRNYGSGGYGILARRGAVEATGWSPEPNETGRIVPGTWTHVAYVSDNRISKLYLNGQLVGEQTIKHVFFPSLMPLILGGSPFTEGGKSCHWTGALADVAIWSRPLDKGQIRRTMERRLNGNEPNLIAYFPMDEMAGEGVHDLTGHTLGAKIGGPADKENDRPEWRQGPEVAGASTFGNRAKAEGASVLEQRTSSIGLTRDFHRRAVTFEAYDTREKRLLPLNYQFKQNVGLSGSLFHSGSTYMIHEGSFPYIVLDDKQQMVFMHPGTFGTAYLGAVATATISEPGTYLVSGAFARENNLRAGDGVRVVVYRNDDIAHPLVDGVISSQHKVDPLNPFAGDGVVPFNFSVDLKTLQTLHFVVFSGPKNVDGTYDLTALKFVATRQ
jgi:hypothetical protein